MDLEIMVKMLPILLKATRYTIVMSLIALIFSLILAIIIAIIIYYDVKIAAPVFKAYVSFFKGTPALCQLYLIYYGVAGMGIAFLDSMSAYTAAIIALSLNMSAYMAENLRGALSSVDKGQNEAGLSIGLNKLQIFVYIVFPQAIRIAIPSLSNGYVDLVKGTSIAFTVGVGELMAAANLQGMSNYRFLEAFLMAAIIYWLITMLISFGQKKLEKHMARKY